MLRTAAGWGGLTTGAALPIQVVIRRSVLYVPGSNTRALAKAGSCGADALIVDLEDAVAPHSKPEARQNALELPRLERGELAIRINPLTSE